MSVGILKPQLRTELKILLYLTGSWQTSLNNSVLSKADALILMRYTSFDEISKLKIPSAQRKSCMIIRSKHMKEGSQ